jgi:hypothetical protein
MSRCSVLNARLQNEGPLESSRTHRRRDAVGMSRPGQLNRNRPEVLSSTRLADNKETRSWIERSPRLSDNGHDAGTVSVRERYAHLGKTRGVVQHVSVQGR